MKISLEKKVGLKNTMLQCFKNNPIAEYNWFSISKNKAIFWRLIYATCFIHSIIIERKNYLNIGFNISYSFNILDLEVSVRQIKVFLEEYENDIPL